MNPSQTHSTRDYVVTYEHSHPHLRPNPWNPTFATFQAREVILHFLFSPPPWLLRPPRWFFLFAFQAEEPPLHVDRQGDMGTFLASQTGTGGSFVSRTLLVTRGASRGLPSTISVFVFVCARPVCVCVPDARRLETWCFFPQNTPFDPGAAEAR